MAENKSNGSTATADQSAFASATTEIFTQMARSAAGELVKGQQPMSEVARKVVGEAVTDLDKRGPELVKQAGIMTWQYALLGWVTWNVGKRVIKRKAKAAVSGTKSAVTTSATRTSSAKSSGAKKGGTRDAAESSQRGRRDDD